MVTVELANVLLFIAVAGIFLLLARDWTVRVVGAALIVPRLLAAPLTDGEVIIFGCGIAAAGARVIYGWSYGPAGPTVTAPEAPDQPETDDVSEPAVCVACRAVIPAGQNTCPQCGWSYAATDRNAP